MRGSCRHCGENQQVRLDGLIRVHGPHPFGPGQWDCPGSKHNPTEGVVMDCVWCRRLFISGDEDHLFCSETCVEEWETWDGSWDGWDLKGWLEEREERSDDR